MREKTMKKNANKKLSVSKRTISNLDNSKMQKIKGGYITGTCPDWCATNHNCTSGCPSINPRYCW